MNTDQFQRTWSLLSWPERARLIGQCSGVMSVNAALPLLATYAVDAFRARDLPLWITALVFTSVLLAAAALGLVWFFARPGSRAWRRR